MRGRCQYNEMLYRFFECTPEYLAADHDNLYLEDVFPIDAKYWQRCDRQPHECHVLSMTVYEVYHKAAIWPHMFTCLTVIPAKSLNTRDRNNASFRSRELTQIALHRYQDRDIALGSFVPEAVVYGIKHMARGRQPTAIESVQFIGGLRLDVILTIFNDYTFHDCNKFAKYTKNCMWLTGSIFWKTLAKSEEFISIPSRTTYTDFVTQKMQALRKHSMIPWLWWSARSFWTSDETTWMFEIPLFKGERLQKQKSLLASLQKLKFMKEADLDADTRSIEELDDRIKRLEADIEKEDRES